MFTNYSAETKSGTDMKTDIQEDRQTGRQTDRQEDRQTDAVHSLVPPRLLWSRGDNEGNIDSRAFEIVGNIPYDRSSDC